MAEPNKIITVLIVDDSAVMRQVATAMLGQDPEIRVIGTAADPIFAQEKLRKEWPDVIVLDVEMPRMDGISFLRQIMQQRPTPVVICSTLTTAGANTTMEALAAGAVSIMAKPTVGLKSFITESANELVQAVKAAARANVRLLHSSPAAPINPAPKLSADAVLAATPASAMSRTTERVVAIGTSTGGTQALEVVLRGLPANAPGMVIVQHMPERFTAAFAARLNQICTVEVLEGKTGDRIIPGRAIIAPGGKHLLLRRNGAQYQVEVRDGPLVNRHRPSVDVLFRSVAQFAGRNAMGVIMTGMGDDGARGMKEMHDAGARTVAQDEASSVVYGMPREAVRLGGVDKSLPLSDIARAIMAG